MPTIDANYRAAIVATIKAAWTEIVGGKGSVAGSISWESKMNRQNWEALVNSSDLVTPYVIVEIGSKAPVDEGPNDAIVHRVPTCVTYITDQTDTGAYIDPLDHTKGRDIFAYLDDKGRALVQALVNYSGSAYQLAGQHPQVDASSTNSANQVFYDLQSKKQAVEITFSPVIGEYF